LQYALTELVERDEVSSLSLESYRAIGSVSGALARRAERLYGAMNEPGRDACRQLFLRLVTLGEGTEDTRRRVRRSEIPAMDGATDGVIESFGRHRLLSFDRDALSREPTVEIAHEALLHQWPRLRDWLGEDAEVRALRGHLMDAARQWDAGGRDDSELYRGARLAGALDFSSRDGRHLNELERDFVARSRDASERETRRIRRTNRRLRALLVGVALLLVVALVAGALAVVQRGRAQRSATVALSQSLGAKAVAETKLDTALLLAEEGVKLDDSLETRSNLLTVLLHSPSAIRVLHPGTLGSSPVALAVAPDDRTLAVVNLDGSLRFYDTATGALVGDSIRGVGASGLKLPFFTPDGSEIAVVRGKGVQFIDVRSHRIASTIEVRGGSDKLLSPVLLSADGAVVYLVLARADQPFDRRAEVDAFDASSGRLLRRVVVPGLACQGIAIAHDTGEIVTLTPANGGLIEVRDGGTLAVKRSFPVPLPVNKGYPGCSNYVLGVSEDGRTAAYAVSNVGGDESLRFVDLQTGKVRPANGVAAGGDLVAVSPDGTRAFSATDDYLHLSVWDVASATLMQTLSGHSGAIESAIFDPTGRTLYSASDDGSVFAWDLPGTRSFGHGFSAGPGSPRGGGFPYTHFSASPDGTSIAVPYGEERLDGSGGGVNIVDLASGRVTTRVQVAGRASGIDSVSYAEFSPRGTELLVSPGPASNGDITLWRLDPGPPRLVRTFSGLTATPVPEEGGFFEAPWATFSPDGKWIAGVDRHENGDSRLIEWNAATGAERTAPLDLRWRETDGPVSRNVVYSPDGALIATSVPGDRAVIVDARTLRTVRTLRDPHGVAFVAFSPTNPSLLAEGSADVGIIRLWDVTTGRQIGQAEGSNTTFGGMGSLQFDSTGDFLLTEGVVDAAARLWSVPGLQQVGTDLPGVPSRFGTATFAGRGTSTLAVLVYQTGEALVYHASPASWERQACAVAGRNFTKAEWDRYLPDRPYSKVCPDV
jgi:WD40 repeat protein